MPLSDWLRGPLAPLVEETLFSGELYPAGVFDRAALRSYWEGMKRGENRKWGLWTLLSLQWWAKTHLPGTAAA